MTWIYYPSAAGVFRFAVGVRNLGAPGEGLPRPADGAVWILGLFGVDDARAVQISLDIRSLGIAQAQKLIKIMNVLAQGEKLAGGAFFVWRIVPLLFSAMNLRINKVKYEVE